MEYDDNDFRSQNLQLAGEGNTKYPPVLHPFALPKFDFDENLHGHLRFGSLVESEVLLGIEGNEDNRWIEDYSRESSEIHFSSTAVETCSIPRRNNVWSEATSLESVEMLLKSVGQDGNIPARTLIKESDDCDELGCIVKKMEHSSKLGDNSRSKVEDVKDLQPTGPLDETFAKLSGLEEIVESKQPHAKDYSQTESSVSRSSWKQADYSVSGVEHHLGEAAQLDDKNLGGNAIESVDHSENRIYSGFKADPVEEKNTANASMDYMDEPSKITLKGINDFHEVDGSSVDVDFRTTTHVQECENVFKYLEAVDKTVTLEGDPSSQRQEVEISNMKSTDSKPVEGFVAQTSQGVSCCTEKKDNSESACFDSTIMVNKSGDAVIPSISAQSTVISESNIVLMRDVHECDKVVSVVEEGDTGLGALISRKESEVRRSTIIDESGGGSNANELIVSESDATAQNKSGSAEPFNTLILASPHKNAQNADHQDQKSALSVVDVEHERESVTIISPEGRLPNLESSQVTTEIGHSLERMKESHSKPQEGLVNKVCRESANEMEGDYAVSGPRVGQVNGAEASAVLEKAQKDEEALAKEVHEKVSGDFQKRNEGSLNSTPLSEFHPRSHAPGNETLSADHDKSSCGSPTVIKAITNLSQSESEETKVKGSTNQNIPFAENTERDSSNNLSVSPDLRGDGASKGGDSFTFEVKSLGDASTKEAGKSWQSFPAMRTCNLSPTVEGSLSTSTLDKSDPKTPPGASLRSLKVSAAEVVQGGAVVSSGRKPRRASAKASGKKTSKKGKSTKETTPSTRRKLGKADKTSMVSHSPSRIGHLVQSGEVQHNGVGVKPLASLATLTSGLPDLNTSTASAIFHQPFTDLQQVQLRAQIFVYGALIQGTAPDEAYMISAFGGLDGGKSSWENGWRTCLERLHGQKSHLTTPEIPLQPRSRTAHDKPNKQSSPLSNATSTVNKGTPSAIASPLGPLSSPLRSIPVPSGDAMQSRALPIGAVINYQQAPTPLRAHQTTQISTFVGHNASWISQGPFCAPWVASPQPSTIGNIAHFPKVPNTEAVKLTPVKEPSVPRSIKHVPASIAQSASSASVFLTSAPSPDTKGIIAGKQSTDPKPRRRKKNMVSEDQNQIVLNFQLQTEPVSTPLGDGKLSAAVTIPTANLVSNTPKEKFVMPLFPMTAAEHLNKRDHDIEQRAKLSNEILGKLKEAKVNAEDAAVLAAAAISHSKKIWNQMDKQKSSGLEPDVETKLTSAAAAIAAAAAVSKAAAAAANVASNAALQAKMMAEEALSSNVLGNSSQTRRLLSDGVTTLATATPSVFKGVAVANSSSSVILAAREASRRRVEAASAASKRAENIYAIVKAAELVAEAVSQAEKLVAMGEPSPLGKLVKAGPDSCWNVTQASSDYMNRENLNASGDGTEISARQLKEASADKIESQTNNNPESLAPRDAASEPVKNHIRSTGGISNSVAATRDAKKRQKGHRDFVEESLKENSIKEGSLVEVYKNDGGYKAAWHTANVLSLKDGKAFVCYNELMTSNESLEKLNEWVALEGEDDKAPKVRIARPITVRPFEGTKKRRRAAMGDYSWSVGDKVDVWAQDGWREGIISEKTKKDDTTLTVHFPGCLDAQGETSVVRAWNLRRSLVWKDGEWVEWFNSKGNDISSLEDDTPQEKRQRMVSSTNEAKGKDISIEVMESGKPDDSFKLLELSENEKIFNLGKNTKDENKPGAHRTARVGLQKEGSKVVFGVPKQGKKRKFMEVSKHYVADRASKVNKANDSVKLAKYLMPRGIGSRESKNVPINEPEEIRAAPSKPGVLKPGKPQSLLSGTLPQNENFLAASVCAPDDGVVSDNNTNSKNSVSHVENTSGKHSSMEFQSFTSSKGAAEGPIIFSSTTLTLDAPPKKVSNAKSEQASKGKRTARRLPKIDEDKVSISSSAKTTSEVEIRRSNRRIQPTSRLLEGLQSSLIPSVSHDKGYRSQNRTNSRGHA